MKTQAEPKVIYGEEQYGLRVARLSNGAMCIVRKTYSNERKRKSWKWVAVKCEPKVFEMENFDTGEMERYVLGYTEVKGVFAEKAYGKTRKDAVLDCLIMSWYNN